MASGKQGCESPEERYILRVAHDKEEGGGLLS